MKLDTPRIRRIIAEHNLHMCLECGKCSSCCPRFISGKQYSPRMLAQKLIAAQPEDRAYIETSVWDCLTCGQCQERCPSGVQFVQMILDMRSELAAALPGLDVAFPRPDAALRAAELALEAVRERP